MILSKNAATLFVHQGLSAVVSCDVAIDHTEV